MDKFVSPALIFIRDRMECEGDFNGKRLNEGKTECH